MHNAPLPLQPGKTIPYAHVHPTQPQHERPILYVACLGESILNKASLAAELATQGYDVVMPGQNRNGMLCDANNKPNATLTQAQNTLTVVKDALHAGQPFDVITHSYDSLVLQEMVKLAPELLEQSNVICLTPAGSIDNDALPSVLRRWITYAAKVGDQNLMVVPGTTGIGEKTSLGVLSANIPRTFREVRELVDTHMNYNHLANSVGLLAVLSCPGDNSLPDDLLTTGLDREFSEDGSDKLRWASPVAFTNQPSTHIDSSWTTHDAKQCYPSRIVGTIYQLLPERYIACLLCN